MLHVTNYLLRSSLPIAPTFILGPPVFLFKTIVCPNANELLEIARLSLSSLDFYFFKLTGDHLNSTGRVGKDVVFFFLS